MAAEDQLTRVPLFQDLPKKSLERIAKTIRTRNFRAGDVIFKEGEEADALFAFLKDGVAGAEVARADRLGDAFDGLPGEVLEERNAAQLIFGGHCRLLYAGLPATCGL